MSEEPVNFDNLLTEVEFAYQNHIFRARNRVNAYFRKAFFDAGNNLTAAILQKADLLYDYEGMPDAIAQALVMDRTELQWHLGRPAIAVCVECRKKFTAVERRRKGGYTPPLEYKCDHCLEGSRRKRRAVS